MIRLYWLGEVLDSTLIATQTVIFIHIGQLFRKISTDKLFRTGRQTQTHTHVKLKTSFLGVSVLVESGNELNFEFLTVFQYFHSFYEHGSKKLDTTDPNTDIRKVFGITREQFRDIFEQLGDISYHSMTSLNELRISLDSIQGHPWTVKGYLLPFRHIPKWFRNILKQLRNILNYYGISLNFRTSVNGLGIYH